MKILFDFLPIVLFFGVFKYAENHKAWATVFVGEHLSFMVSGGVVDAETAPMLLATLVVIAATLIQIGIMLVRGKKVDFMLWTSLVLITVLGGATIWFHDANFIKWKPTVLYWVMGAGFLFSSLLFKKNLLKKLMGEQLDLPSFVWQRLNVAWVAFFAFMGALNLYVAYHFSLDTWVNFKAFGSLGLMLVFTILQGIYLSRHLVEKPSVESTQKNGH
jgi:intracellular septation protein